jgi:hypothetical protein
MATRRTRWIWMGAAAFLLILLAGWVFKASLIEQRKPLSSFGGENWGRPGDLSSGLPQPMDPNTPANNPSMDPQVQETLRTINEINRINKMNVELTKNKPVSTSPNTEIPVPPHALPPRSDVESEPEADPKDKPKNR